MMIEVMSLFPTAITTMTALMTNATTMNNTTSTTLDNNEDNDNEEKAKRKYDKYSTNYIFYVDVDCLADGNDI